MTSFVIDPNVRVRGNLTYAGIEDADRELTAADAGLYVEVREPEAGLFGKAQIVEVDPVRGLVYLDVAWDQLRPATSEPANVGARLTVAPATSVLLGSPTIEPARQERVAVITGLTPISA